MSICLFFWSWFTRGSQATIITSTTLEVVVPSSLVPIIYGEDGECLKQIRQVHCFISEFIYRLDLHSQTLCYFVIRNSINVPGTNALHLAYHGNFGCMSPNWTNPLAVIN